MQSDFFERKEWKRMMQFVLAVYRVTSLFPQGEVLTERLRDSACDLAQFFAFSFPPGTRTPSSQKIKKDFLFRLRAFKSLFIIAREEVYVRKVNFDILLNELEYFEKIVLIEEMKKPSLFLIPAAAKKKSTKPKSAEQKTNTRTRKVSEDKRRQILEFLKKQPTKMTDIKSLFPAMTARTIQRHLERLSAANLIVADGEGRQRIYRAKK